MPFSDFKSIEQVISAYPLELVQKGFLPGRRLKLPALFLADLNFSLERQAAHESEIYFRESLISPFLRKAWQRHPRLKLWVNRNLRYDDRLSGEPDYFVAADTAREITDRLDKRPLMAVAEAKREDFEEGWGQCLAGMIACRELNAPEILTIYGIVSTGHTWQFSKLNGPVFTRDPLSYSIADPQRVFGLLDFVFGECERQLAN